MNKSRIPGWLLAGTLAFGLPAAAQAITVSPSMDQAALTAAVADAKAANESLASIAQALLDAGIGPGDVTQALLEAGFGVGEVVFTVIGLTDADATVAVVSRAAFLAGNPTATEIIITAALEAGADRDDVDRGLALVSVNSVKPAAGAPGGVASPN